MAKGRRLFTVADTELSAAVDAPGADCTECVISTSTDLCSELDDPVEEGRRLFVSAETESGISWGVLELPGCE